VIDLSDRSRLIQRTQTAGHKKAAEIGSREK
jgi:hypothetical protein